MTPLSAQLGNYGLSLGLLSARAEAVILFGSQAADVARGDSDWDILVVGPGRSRLRRGLDLVYVDPKTFQTAGWRSSELASHIGRWGRTLSGAPGWLSSLEDAKPGDAALAVKRRQLRAQLGACERFWSSLGSWAQLTRQRRIRRDLQRHARILKSLPVPPSALLDSEWTQLSNDEQSSWLNRWLTLAELGAHNGPWIEQSP